jgi:hypothetical protein
MASFGVALKVIRAAKTFGAVGHDQGTGWGVMAVDRTTTLFSADLTNSYVSRLMFEGTRSTYCSNGTFRPITTCRLSAETRITI